MKSGILLSGGSGTRLLPLTQVINKHLLGINGKFIIDYPIENLKQLGCQNITVILGGQHFAQIVSYLGDGSRQGVNLNYVYQSEPKGIAHAINLCERFVKGNEFTVILGDNIFEEELSWNVNDSNAQIMLANHPDLSRFGVASIRNGKIIKIEEKPQVLDASVANLAISGCYRFNDSFFDYFKSIKPSMRGEYEITDIILKYLQDDCLSYRYIKGLWSDAGTHESINYINRYFLSKSFE